MNREGAKDAKEEPPLPPQGGKEEDAALPLCPSRLRGSIVPIQPELI
ncbi:MAG: hypothetical protein P2A85_02825 [Microcoleus anatoxicus]